MSEFFRQLGELIYAAVGFYAMLLIRCAILSFPVILILLFFRRFVLKNAIFGRCLVWLMIIPVPFLGRLHIFYETKLLANIFVNLQGICFEYYWISCIYLGIAAIILGTSCIRNIRLSKYIKTLEQINISGTTVYINEVHMTPFVYGIFRPKIIIPKYLIEQEGRTCQQDDLDELSTILLHEKTHIRQGHLILLAIWNIIRILFWINPLLFISTRLLKEDLEAACDRSVIRITGCSPIEYGDMLLRNLKAILKTTSSQGTLALFGTTAFRSLKHRIIGIKEYKTYSPKRAHISVAASILAVFLTLILIKIISYQRINAMNNISVYNATDFETIILVDNSDLSATSSFDDKYLYFDADLLDQIIDLDKYKDKELWIYFGGFYKLPGIGGGGEVAVVKGNDIGTGMVKIPYEEAQDTLVITLLKLM